MIERFLKPKSQTYLNLNFLISYSLLDFCRLELISQLCFCFLKKKNLWRNFILQKELTAVFTSLSKFAFWSLNPLLLSSILVSKRFFISFYLISSGYIYYGSVKVGVLSDYGRIMYFYSLDYYTTGEINRPIGGIRGIKVLVLFTRTIFLKCYFAKCEILPVLYFTSMAAFSHSASLIPASLLAWSNARISRKSCIFLKISISCISSKWCWKAMTWLHL